MFFLPVKILCKLFNLKYYFTFVSLLTFTVISIQLLKQIWFLLVRKGSQTKGSSEKLDDFDQDMIIGNGASDRQKNVVVNEGTNDQDFTVGTSNVSSIVDENALNVRTLERCFNERIDREGNNIVETVEDRIQNAILTAIDNIVAHVKYMPKSRHT